MGKYGSYVNAEGAGISKATGKPLKKYNKANKAYRAAREGRTVAGVQQPVVEADPLTEELKSYYNEEELKGIVGLKKDAAPVEPVEIKTGTKNSLDGGNTGFPVASGRHAEETVKASTVLGPDESNSEISGQRIENFFPNAIYMTKKKPADNPVVGFLGDMTGGYIHDGPAQTNGLSPVQGVAFVKKPIISGLKAIRDGLPELQKIIVAGIGGNHSRTTKRLQPNNGFALNHEYLLYRDIGQALALMGPTKFEYAVPEGGLAYPDICGKKILSAHGFQFRSPGGVGGLYPAMLRWFGKRSQVIKIDKAFLGHWHSSIYTKGVCINGSLKGYDAFATGRGLSYEVPQQTYVILSERRGFISYSPVFAD